MKGRRPKTPPKGSPPPPAGAPSDDTPAYPEGAPMPAGPGTPHTATRRTTRRGPRPGPGGAKPPFTVFLDRDGVFNRNPKLAVFRKNGFIWLPGALEAFSRLNRPGIQTCLATNQPFLGTFTLGMRVGPVNRALKARLEQAGGRLDRMEAAWAPPWIGFLRKVAPGRFGKALLRRKPGPGMLQDGGAALGVDKTRAVMVGDKVKDAQAAAGYGIPAILLATTHGEAKLRAEAERKGVAVHAIVPGLEQAVDIILDMAGRK